MFVLIINFYNKYWSYLKTAEHGNNLVLPCSDFLLPNGKMNSYLKTAGQGKYLDLSCPETPSSDSGKMGRYKYVVIRI